MTTIAELNPVSNVPKLEVDGTNWVMFSTRLRIALNDKDVYGHLDGTSVKPDPDADAEGYSAWLKKENQALNLLTQKLHDSTLTKLLSLSSAAEWWTAVTKEFTVKSSHVVAAMRTAFEKMKCADGGNIRTHLDKLRAKHEDLIRVGVTIPLDQWSTRIIGSLPEQYQKHLATIEAAARAAALATTALAQATTPAVTPTVSTFSVSPDLLMALAIEEYDRIIAGGTRGKAKDSDTGVALSATNSGNNRSQLNANHGRGKPNQSQSKEPRPRGVCWNCGGKGHVQSQCPSPKMSGGDGAAKGKDEKKKDGGAGGSANAAISEDDGVWSVFEPADLFADDSSISALSDTESVSSWDYIYSNSSASSMADDDGNSMPDLQEVSDSETESDSGDDESSDWLSEVGDEESSEASTLGDALLEALSAELADIFEDDFSGDSVDAALTEEALSAGPRIELYDSGSTQHLSPYRDQFTSYRDIPPRPFTAANQQTFNATGTGDMVIEVPDGVDTSKLALTEVLYSPEIGYTLISVGRLDDAGLSATFGQGKCEILGSDGERIGAIPKSGKGLYRVVHESVEPQSSADSANAATTRITPLEAHRRFGHIAPAAAKRLVTHGFVTGLELDTSGEEPTFCESCVYAKSRRQTIPKVREGECAKSFGEEIHSDVWGPSPIQSLGGRQYFVTFTDDYSRHSHLYLLRKKSDTFAAYKLFEAWSKLHLKASIKVLHSDRGGEYLSGPFINHLRTAGTEQKLTVHDTPEENGVSERLNGVVLQRVRAVLHASGLPKSLWGEAVRHVIWLKNRTSTKAVPSGKTPYELVTGKKPNLSQLHEWGCSVWVHDITGSKLDGRAKEGRWVGFDEQSKGSRVYWPEKRTVTVERSVVFTSPSVVIDGLEGEDSAEPEHSVKSPSSTSHQNDNSNDAPVPDIPAVMPSRPQRTRKPTQYVRDVLEGRGTATGLASRPAIPTGIQVPPTSQEDEIEGENADENAAESVMVVDVTDAEALEPRSLAEAKRRPDWPQWERAIHEELKTLEEAKTWRLQTPPAEAHIVGSKWVFKVKKDAGGRVIRHKARLVAQGFTQVEGVNYFDTYAPVAKLASFRTILALAARLDLELHQIDIKGAYLNGELTNEEVIYMRQPPGFPYANSSGKVLRLQKTIYGLKQSGRRWYQKFTEICEKHLRLTRCSVDQAVFYRREGQLIIVIAVHVDDCTIAASNQTLVREVKSTLNAHVEVTDLGEVHWLLGIEVKRDREARTISLSQSAYIRSILHRFNFDELKPVSTPMEPYLKLSSSQSPNTADEFAAMRDIPYRESIGSLMYASIATRPDITYAVSRLSKYLENPGDAHWQASTRVFRYLKGTVDWWLTYGEREEKLTGWVDADGSQEEDRRAITGYAFLIDGGAVSWNSKQQELIVLSTTEGEYVAATHAAKEALWLRSLISEVFGDILEATTLFSDNQSAIALSKDHQYHARTKHIDIRYHFIRWVIENGSIRLIYCPTEDMLADTLTKPLPSFKAKHFASELGLRVA
jgi:hypothetical protein